MARCHPLQQVVDQVVLDARPSCSSSAQHCFSSPQQCAVRSVTAQLSRQCTNTYVLYHRTSTKVARARMSQVWQSQNYSTAPMQGLAQNRREDQKPSF